MPIPTPPPPPPSPKPVATCYASPGPVPTQTPAPAPTPTDADTIVVAVSVELDATGKPLGAKVVNSSGNLAMDAAAVRAAMKSVYQPRVANCVPVSSTYVFYVTFVPE